MNLVYLTPGETGGMETYARELISALVRLRPDLRLTSFVNRDTYGSPGPWTELSTSVRVPVSVKRRMEWVRAEQQLLPRLADRAGVDVLHSLASTAPAIGAFRRITTIHDLIYRAMPEAHSGVRSLGMRALVPLAARRSHRIIVPSESTRADVIKYLHVESAKIDVVPHGVGVRASTTGVGDVRRCQDLGERKVVLTLSAKRPHKNLMRLLDAWARLPAPRPLLVMPGYPTWHEEELRRHASNLGLDHDVRFMGWIDPSEVECLYAVATCFVFPSLYEGFGLPILEAMARDVPVACSARPSLSEVAGDAARFFDPEDSADIAMAISDVLNDQALRTRLIAAGRERATKFTWEEAARATHASYERALQ